MSNAASAVPAPRLTVPAGTLVDDKYRLERFLGQGDMGCVFLVTHVLTGESLALKVLYPVDPSQGPAAFAAFIVAARVAARFRSEHVAHVRDMGLLEDGGPFLVMDYFQGETLETHLRKRGPLAIGEAVDLALQAARGLSEAHEAGVVHRDAKPSNWFLTETPDGSTRVKLLDFGVAKIAPRAGSAEEPSPSGPGQVGWIPYAAPEQIRSPAAVDGRADIWTVGVVLHEMLAGATPSGRSTMRQARDRALMASRPWLRQTEGPVSAELEDVVMRCLERRRENRFGDMADLVLALAPFQAGVGRASVEGAAVGHTVHSSSSVAPVTFTITSLRESVAPPGGIPPILGETPAPAGTVAVRPGFDSRFTPFLPESMPMAPAGPRDMPVAWMDVEDPAERPIGWLRRLSRGRLVAGAAVLVAAGGAVLFFATQSEEPSPTLAAPYSPIATLSARPVAAASATVDSKAVASAELDGLASPLASSSPQSAARVSERPIAPIPAPEARATKPAARPSSSSATKASFAHSAPVGTAGFGDRE